MKFRARWVFPVDAPPIENGVVEIENGRITALHDSPSGAETDLGNAALLPALVNCHAHLEFSSLAEPLAPATPFTSWIKSLVAYRRSRTTPVDDSIREGLTQSLQSGVGLVGEIATIDWPLEYDRADAPSLVVFRECLGRTPEQQRTQLESARRHLELGKKTPISNGLSAPHPIHGISPHAPYSVHPDLLRDLVSLAVEFDAPVAMHLAETRAELELLKNGTGEFAEMLRQFGAWDPAIFDGSRTILDDLHQLSRASRSLVIHGNYLTEEEIEFLADRKQFSVIYCPRTHHYFGHVDHPWKRLLQRGVNVALGTDGRGSNPDLSIWDEVAFLAHRTDPEDLAGLLSMATLKGARALGVEREFGSLTPGKPARLIAIPLDRASEGTDPYRVLFSANSSPRTVSLEPVE